jgi:two-component system, LytTR family, response regulator LytT
MRILAVEDEIVAARRLERLSSKILGEQLDLFHIAHDLDSARLALAGKAFDLILLDLNLVGEDGFDLLTSSGFEIPVIVVSANAHRAIKAFALAVLDFVPKPVDEERLRQAFRRLHRVDSGPKPQRLAVQSRGKIDIIDLGDIVRIAGADDYCEIQLADGRSLLCDLLLAELEARLPPRSFVRVHRSYLVNLANVQIARLRWARPTLVHRNGLETPVSRRRIAAVKDRMSRPIND